MLEDDRPTSTSGVSWNNLLGLEGCVTMNAAIPVYHGEARGDDDSLDHGKEREREYLMLWVKPLILKMWATCLQRWFERK